MWLIDHSDLHPRDLCDFRQQYHNLMKSNRLDLFPHFINGKNASFFINKQFFDETNIQKLHPDSFEQKLYHRCMSVAQQLNQID